jgi:hypothetical protein
MTMVVSYQFIPFHPGARAAPLALTYLSAGFDFITSLIVLPLVLRIAYLFPDRRDRCVYCCFHQPVDVE